MGQKWSRNSSDRRWYVYTYEDAGGVYYVGKGTNNRACAHVVGGRDVITIRIVARDMTEQEAIELETTMINTLPNLENKLVPKKYRVYNESTGESFYTDNVTKAAKALGLNPDTFWSVAGKGNTHHGWKFDKVI